MKNLLIFFCVIIFLSSCGNSSRQRGKSAQQNDTDATFHLYSPENKPIINVYLENSASMDGYVKGVTEFEQAIYNYLSDIKISELTDTLNLFYINSQIIPQGSDIADFIEKLEPSTFRAKGGNRGTTDMSNVLKTILENTKENDVAMLITDGIFSPGKGKNAKQYLVNQQIGIKTAMAQYLKLFPNTAVVVYQLTSQFDGTYYNREDYPKHINAQRPYYIWVVGNVANIAVLKTLIPEKNFKGSGVLHSFTLLPSSDREINYAILNSPRLGSFDREKSMPKTSIYNIKKASKGEHQGQFMFTVGMELSLFSVLLGDEYLMNTKSYARLINKQPNNDYYIEIEHNTNPNTKYTHNMKLTTAQISLGEMEIILRSVLPEWISAANDDDGLNIENDDAMNKTFGIKYLVGGIYEAYQMRGNDIYTIMKFNLKK